MKQKKVKSKGKAKGKRNRFSLPQLEITLGIVLALALVLSFFGPGITGFVSADTYRHRLDLTLDKSTIFLISSVEELTISSFKISGEVENGGVKVYLDDLKGQKLVIYENLEEKKEGLNMVTGMAIGGVHGDPEIINDEQFLEVRKLDEFDEYVELDKTNKELKTGPFEAECEETCFIKMLIGPGRDYKLVVFLEEGTVFELDELLVTVAED